MVSPILSRSHWFRVIAMFPVTIPLFGASLGILLSRYLSCSGFCPLVWTICPFAYQPPSFPPFLLFPYIRFGNLRLLVIILPLPPLVCVFVQMRQWLEQHGQQLYGVSPAPVILNKLLPRWPQSGRARHCPRRNSHTLDASLLERACLSSSSAKLNRFFSKSVTGNDRSCLSPYIKFRFVI